MNLIQRQAEQFHRQNFHMSNTAQEYISEVRSALYDYKKDAYKLEYLQTMLAIVKTAQDKHDTTCPKGANCSTYQFNEEVLFFLQQEVDEIDGSLSRSNFTLHEKTEVTNSLNLILADLNQLKHGQEITYTDLEAAIADVRQLYFLDKKNWIQLLAGKLTEMVAGGVVTEAVSKQIIQTLTERYPDLIN